MNLLIKCSSSLDQTKISETVNPEFTIDSQIWPALPANFLTLRVWEGTGAIEDDKYLKWQ